VIGHGSSSPRAIATAIDVAARSVRGRLEDAIGQAIEARVATPLEVATGGDAPSRAEMAQ